MALAFRINRSRFGKFYPRFRRKGGEGVFLRKIPRMLLMGLELRCGYLVCFARFCDTFATYWPRLRRRFLGYLLSWCSLSRGLVLLCAFGS